MIPEIKTKNIKPIIRKRIEEIIEKLKSKPEVEGIVYLGGLANTWDYGPLGNELKNNVKAAWRKKFIISFIIKN